ncbi:hypothetical protein FRB90_005517 [Tulasnella sp. 427]|nr:hypothetical protein FRB90_005517 [Tulasnella sp. 427]
MDVAPTPTKRSTFKRLYMTPIQDLPQIIAQSSRVTSGFEPLAMPIVGTNGPIQLVYEPSLPHSLIQSLDLYADAIQEDQLYQDILTMAEHWIDLAQMRVRKVKLRKEPSVLPAFHDIVVKPVQSLCEAIDLEVDYGEAPKVNNVIPDHAWLLDETPFALFEHKMPGVAAAHFPTIVNLAKRGTTVDLNVSSKGGLSIIAKLEYFSIYCLTMFLFVRVAQNEDTGKWQASISKIIPLNSEETPIIATVLALLLHAQPNQSALRYPPITIPAENTGESMSDIEEAAFGLDGANDQQSSLLSTTDPGPSQSTTFNPPNVTLYWEARHIPQIMLAALLDSINNLPLYWDLKPYSKVVFHPVRRPASSVWRTALPEEAVPRLLTHSMQEHHSTPPPSPPMTPFALRLYKAVGVGSVGTVYQGQFHGLGTNIIVKVLPTDAMDHELEIWRKLRDFAGISVPGLFGAYSLERKDGCGSTGALVQQYAGRSISSFDALNRQQR